MVYIFDLYQPLPEIRMTTTAKLFMNGRSQAVRLPAEFRFEGTEVFIERQGDTVVLRPKPVGWDDFFAAASRTPDDFLDDREQGLPQERGWPDALDA
jgi:antitoxin VapB